MGISTPVHNMRMMTSGALTVRDDGTSPAAVVWTPRIGVTVGADRLWRCAAPDSRAVSGIRAWLARGAGAPMPPSDGRR
jgi:3-methyladenine DNA glycosylase Mpg